MEWTPELAIETDQRVRAELRTSRASLIRFIAEGAWRMLPQQYPTAAAYVQDAAGVKRSEAYRLVATARAAEIILTRVVVDEDSDAGLDIRAYRWIVNDVIRSSHTGEALASSIHDVVVKIEEHQAAGMDVWDAISATVDQFRKSNRANLGPENQEPARSPADNTDTELAEVHSPDDVKPPKAPRVIVCPSCGHQMT